jgi:transcriptional regulator with XRE-family HTH domain
VARTKPQAAASERNTPAEIRIGVGRKLRELRTARRLTVRALAASVGVTSGFISQIENGQVLPSVATLVSLAGALGVQVGELFDGLPQTSHQVVRREERTRYEVNPGLVDEVLSRDATRELEVLLRYHEPGTGSGELYTHGTKVEFALVLKGKIEFRLGDETFELGEGDAITLSGDIPAGSVNRGKVPALVLWAMTPAAY